MSEFASCARAFRCARDRKNNRIGKRLAPLPYFASIIVRLRSVASRASLKQCNQVIPATAECECQGGEMEILSEASPVHPGDHWSALGRTDVHPRAKRVSSFREIPSFTVCLLSGGRPRVPPGRTGSPHCRVDGLSRCVRSAHRDVKWVILLFARVWTRRLLQASCS